MLQGGPQYCQAGNVCVEGGGEPPLMLPTRRHRRAGDKDVDQVDPRGLLLPRAPSPKVTEIGRAHV